MKAIRVHTFGGPEVLKYETSVAVPKLVNDNQVLVKIFSAGVNPVDTYIRSGIHARRPELPYIPGDDGAGIIASVGANVKNLKEGQRVYTLFGDGTCAEYVAAEQQNVLPLGDKLTFHEGSALGVPYFTAYRALIQKGHAKPGETVLVHGASGGVGLAACQMARAFGMTVLGTAGTPEGAEVVRKNGAHQVFSHRQENYIQDILAATAGRGVDVIIEMLANVNLAKDLEMIGKNGRIIVVGNRGAIEINPRMTMLKEAAIIGTALMAMTEPEMNEAKAAITSGIESGWVKPVIDKVYPLQDVAKAHHDVINSSGAKGKLVLEISNL